MSFVLKCLWKKCHLQKNRTCENNWAKVFYFPIFTCRENIFSIKNCICREESTESISFKLNNQKN